MREVDADSSEEEWVISSTETTALKKRSMQKPIKTPAPPVHRQQKQAHQKSHRIIPAERRHTPADLKTSCFDYIKDDELHEMCVEMDSKQLVTRLISVYKNSETYVNIRNIETPVFAFDFRLSDHLHECSDPCLFIQDVLFQLAAHFDENAGDKDMTSKFRRQLAHATCSGLERFLDTPPTKQKKLKAKEDNDIDLISFVEDTTMCQEEPNLISFDDDSEGEKDGDDDESPVTTITLAQLLDVPPEIASRYTLTREHQIRCIRMIETIRAPIMVYYAIDIFRLGPFLSKGGEFEEDGAKLCRLLMIHAHYNEAVACIRKLDLFDSFPIDTLADHFFTIGQGLTLPAYVKGIESLQRKLLHIIDVQLRYNFAGSLGIVPKELLETVEQDTKLLPPMARLKERRFQKELMTCGTKIVHELQLPDHEYHFIWLSQRYACLRWIITQRALQQTEESDYSISASSNYNGLLLLVAQDNPALGKLVIKELVDIGDPLAPAHFASLFGQQQFYCDYNGLPLADRVVGKVKGEQISRHRSSLTPKKPRITSPHPTEYYKLPPDSECVVVDDEEKLKRMARLIASTKLCGLDTEWVPQFAKTGPSRTALMQIALDNNIVFLLDLKVMFKPSNAHLLDLTEKILGNMFANTNIIKLGNLLVLICGKANEGGINHSIYLAYDFGGDMTLLRESIPAANSWVVHSMLDFKNIRLSYDSQTGGNIPGGLAGVVSMFLGVGMNKKQQLSNWELRPLTEEQLIYAAGDSFCLLDIYRIMEERKHPFLTTLTKENGSEVRAPSPSTLNIEVPATPHSEQAFISL